MTEKLPHLPRPPNRRDTEPATFDAKADVLLAQHADLRRIQQRLVGLAYERRDGTLAQIADELGDALARSNL